MKYISDLSAGMAIDGLPVVMATGDVTLFRERPQPEHVRFPHAMETLYLFFGFVQFRAQDRCALWWSCSTADWRAIGCHETNIPQASRQRL
ncbi:hypothetical protein ELG62_26245 (plasmid) [Rhizobium leguminosarum]|nr:hypothetical protein ELG62_26245 [Rhizobium leguminosarum]